MVTMIMIMIMIMMIMRKNMITGVPACQRGHNDGYDDLVDFHENKYDNADVSRRLQ